MEDDVNLRSFRADDVTYEKFKSISNTEFDSQGQCLSALINTYEIEKSKKIIPDRKAEIENFQAHVNKLMEMFIMSLELNKDTQMKVRGEFDGLLKSKDLTMASLQEEIKSLNQKKKEILERVNVLENKNRNNEEELSKVKKAAEEELIETKKRAAEESVKNKKIIEDLQNSIKNKDIFTSTIKSKLAEANATIENCKKDISELDTLRKKAYLISFDNERLKAEIEKLTFELEKTKDKYEIDRDKILLEKDKDRQDEIDKYQNKVEELLARLERRSFIENDKIS